MKVSNSELFPTVSFLLLKTMFAAVLGVSDCDKCSHGENAGETREFSQEQPRAVGSRIWGGSPEPWRSQE